MTSNDRTNPQVKVSIEGDIAFVVTTQPAQLRLSGLAGTSMTGEVVLSPGTDLGIEVTEATALKGQCRVTGIEALPGGSYKISVEASPAELPGMLREILEVKILASDGTEHTTQVPVAIDHMDRISIAPRGNIVFQRRDTEVLKTAGSRAVRKDIQLFSSAPDIRFNIKEVELLDVPEGVFETEIRTVKEGERYVVTVFVREYREEPSIRGRLRIVTDDPKAPEKEVRLYAQFGDVARKPNARTLKPGLKPGAAVRPGASLKPGQSARPDPRKPGGTPPSLRPGEKKP